MKRKKFGFFILIALFLFFNLGFKETNNVYVIPIEGEINKATYNFVKNKLEEIDPANTKAVIFEIDTYGGLIDQAINIKDLIISSPIPTISYVNNKAVSAGSLISIASEKVVMSSSAIIGSAEPIPNTEKTLSMWRGVLRDTAQLRGRDPLIMEAMADKDIGIAGIIDKGKLLNLTSTEAIEYQISDGVVDSYEEILAMFNIDNVDIIEINENIQVKITKYIASPYVASFLLTLGFVGLVIEVLTPGFGLGGTISIAGFGLYFGGNILAGNSNWTSLILFMIGMILAVVSMIVPGLGVPEIGSFIFIVAGVILAVDSVTTAILSLSVAIILTAIISVLLIKLGFRSQVLKKIVLDSNHSSEKGFLSTDSMAIYLNKVGLATTDLRPSGFVEIEGQRLDALSESDMITKGSKVKVIKIEGSKIFVRRI